LTKEPPSPGKPLFTNRTLVPVPVALKVMLPGLVKLELALHWTV